MSENKTHPFVSNIQKYSIHDGKGIRTTIFFKGCPLHCRWCHNPETQSYQKQLSILNEKCISCGNCLVCPLGAVKGNSDQIFTDIDQCNACGTCIEECYLNLREINGISYTVDQLVEICEKDKAFYEQSGGGITLSGGEVCTMEPNFILDFMKKLQRKGYRVNLDTCGYVPFDVLEQFIPYTDTFLYDMKCMDSSLHKEMTGVGNELILQNLVQLSRQKKNAKIWIRLPIIGNVNNTSENIEQVICFLKQQQISYEQIHLLPYHNTGDGKYDRFAMQYDRGAFYTPDDTELEVLRNLFTEAGITQVIIGG